MALNFTVMGCRKLNHCVFEKSVQWETPLGKKVVQMWLSVDPMSDKYPHISPYSYCSNNPIKLIDPNGMDIEVFSINESGKVVVDETKASTDAVEVYNAMNKTKTGTEAFKGMVATETKISISITDEKLTDSDGSFVNGLTVPCADGELTKNGVYKEAAVIISTANLGDRFSDASREEKLNVVGVHESVHLSKEQINRDAVRPSTLKYREQPPVMLELQSRMEYHGKGNHSFLPNYQGFLSNKNYKKIMSQF